MSADEKLIAIVSKDTNIQGNTVSKVISLLNEGNTVPFIARYRKEATGGLDEVKIKEIQDRWTYVLNLSERKQEVLRIIEEQGKLTDELRNDIEKATQLQKVEDLYRPYKQKRRTRATIAKEKGLEPFAQAIWEQSESLELEQEATQYFSEEHELSTVEEVLQGVNDIIAEWISDEPAYREFIRNATMKQGTIQSEEKNKAADEKQIFEMYYEYSETVRSLAHRIFSLL